MSSEEIWSNVLNANEHFCKLFIKNLAEIFLKSKDNITVLLEKRDNDTLVLLRIKLHSSLLEVFPDLFYYDLITRRKKALLIDDIYWISQSIVENKVTSRVKQCLKLCSENSNKGQTDSSRGSVARFCMENCVHDGRFDADMVQCHLCQIWYHHDCAGTCSQDLENVVVWTCQICRRLPLLAKLYLGNSRT